jgi:hypothetical protein
MAAKRVEPSITSRSFSCPHCGAHTGQTWFDVYCDQVRTNDDLPWRPTQDLLEHAEAELAEGKVRPQLLMQLERWVRGEVFLDTEHGKDHYRPPQLANAAVSLCQICGRPALWLNAGLIYPPTRHGEEPSEDMPDDVRADYDEARSIVMLSPRGAAALLRLAIQKLCDHLGQKGKKLDAAIGSLVQQGQGLDPRIQRALDIVRVIGNESVHAGQIDLRDDTDTATELFRLVNLIVERMISQPKHVDAMYERVLPASKRQAIDARDKGKS